MTTSSSAVESGESNGASDWRPATVDGPPPPLPDYVRRARRDCPEPLETARALRPLIQEHAAETERTGRIPEPVMRALCESGLWTLKVPKKFGGSEVDARTYFEVIEELSYADGSTGWTVMAAGFGGGLPMLGPPALERVYGGDEGLIVAAQISALGKCERVDGGYRVWDGHFHFGSGSVFAAWFGAAFALQENGEPVLNEHGKPKLIFCFTSRDKVRLVGNWNTFGLNATESYDWDFDDQVVTDDWVAGVPGREPLGPIYAVGVSIAHGAWALGVARRAIDDIHALATRKRRFGRATLIDHQRFQLEYGRKLAALDGARALSIEVFDNWYQAASEGPVPLEVKARARLATCWATEVCLDVAQFAMFSSGSDGLRNSDVNALQRAFRDMQTGATHRHVDQDILIECSQVMLGVNDPLLEL